uniref:MORN repeat-containing protein 5 n=1 Tax=Oxyrrhis marina TaxID=2969 RepID=A0A7S3UKN4_OXYMA
MSQNGYGKQEYENRDVYEGEWEDGKYHGRGTYYYANADKFTGLWTHGVKEGDGTLFFSDGSHSRRVYRNGRLDRVQDFDLQSGKYSGVVRREDVSEGGSKSRPTIIGSPRVERVVDEAAKSSP